MREVELIYVEVMNETEQLLVFETTFNKLMYAKLIILNTALPVKSQDVLLRVLILSLANMTKEDANASIDTRKL